MIKLNSKHPSLHVSPAIAASQETISKLTVSTEHAKSAHRFIVLVSSLDADLASVASRVWELAHASGAFVQFLGLYSDHAQEHSLRRELATMAAMVKDDKVSAEAVVVAGRDWVKVVQTRFQAGDTIVCFAEQQVGFSRTPLSEVLQSNLNVPLYILTGLHRQTSSSFHGLAELMAWAGSLAIIVGFFLLQVKFDHLAADWTHTLLLMISIPVEVCALWVWNSLVG